MEIRQGRLQLVQVGLQAATEADGHGVARRQPHGLVQIGQFLLRLRLQTGPHQQGLRMGQRLVEPQTELLSTASRACFTSPPGNPFNCAIKR